MTLEDDTVYTDGEIAASRFAGATASTVPFERVVLRDVDLTGARLNKLVLTERASHQLRPGQRRVAGERARPFVLAEADFQNAVLSNVVFRSCDLKSAVFFGAQASGADLRGSPSTTCGSAPVTWPGR